MFTLQQPLTGEVTSDIRNVGRTDIFHYVAAGESEYFGQFAGGTWETADERTGVQTGQRTLARAQARGRRVGRCVTLFFTKDF